MGSVSSRQDFVSCPRTSSSSTNPPSSDSASRSHARSPGVTGLYEVSVRSLAGLGVNAADDEVTLSVPLQLSSKRGLVGRLSAYRAHWQASFPRFVTSPQLPSPRVAFL